MTLSEIEETLKVLEARHPGLTEVMLTTLLRAGGWEQRYVDEARLVFRSGSFALGTSVPSVQQEKILPRIQDTQETLLPPAQDIAHQLMSPHSDLPKEEPTVSFITTSVEPKEDVSVQRGGKETNKTEHEYELPHNLPLRPFETSEHIWPFSRYKDVFFGDSNVMPGEPEENSLEEKGTIIPPAQTVPVPVVVPVAQEVKQEVAPEVISVAHVREESPVVSPMSPAIAPDVAQPKPTSTPSVQMNTSVSGDDTLVFTACLMLFLLLLLLWYVYGAGRL